MNWQTQMATHLRVPAAITVNLGAGPGRIEVRSAEFVTNGDTLIGLDCETTRGLRVFVNERFLVSIEELPPPVAD